MSATSTIEAWQRDAGIIRPAECKHCHRSDREMHEYDGLQGLWCEDCAVMHINNEEERLSTCCGRLEHSDIANFCTGCREWAEFECVRCEESPDEQPNRPFNPNLNPNLFPWDTEEIHQERAW